MSAESDWLQEKIHNLSLVELLTLQETITKELRVKIQKVAKKEVLEIKPEQQKRQLVIPGTYKPTRKEIEKHLATVFTTEQLSEIEKLDLEKLHLPPGSKSSTELINEDREGRF